MKISIEQRQHIEHYLQRVTEALQKESLTATSVERLVGMLREQIHESLAERGGEVCTDSMVNEVLTDMPQAGDFAYEASGAIGARFESKRLPRTERWAILVATVLTVLVLLACAEGAGWAIQAIVDRSQDEPGPEAQHVESTETVDPVVEAAQPVVGSAPMQPVAGAEVPAGPETRDKPPAHDVGWIPMLLVVVVVLMVFGVGACLLLVAVGVLSAAIAYRRRSWWSFVRLCLWELAILAGAFGGLAGGVVLMIVSGSSSLRLFGYIGLGLSRGGQSGPVGGG